jgi:pyruvate formate lyase activating enzyme
MTAREVLDKVEEDAAFYARSGGGLTLSGGEPLQQGDFCLSILEEAEHRAVHTAMESCGQAPEETILAACGKLDYLLFDIKHLDSEAHKKATGMGNERILRNLAAVRSAYPHLPIHLRTPLIPGINDDEELIRRIVELARSMDAVHYELLPYHRMGEQKYRFLGREYPYGGPAQVDAGILARLRGIVEEVFPEKD